MMTVREAHLEDLDRLLHLWSEFLAEQGDIDGKLSMSDDADRRFRADLPEWIHDTTRVFEVAEAEGQIAGFVSARLWSLPPIFETVPELFIEYLYVDNSFRRRGIGKALVDRVADCAAEWGAHRIRLSVIDRNAVGKAFWEAMGGETVIREMVVGVHRKESGPPRRPIGFVGNP